MFLDYCFGGLSYVQNCQWCTYVCPAYPLLIFVEGLCRRVVFGLGRENLPVSAKIIMYRDRLYVDRMYV